jgi:hypothetical protein
METIFSAGDHYHNVPVPFVTNDPSCHQEARIFRSKRVPSPDAGSYDPQCEIVTTCGITAVEGREIGWIRVDREGSYFDHNTTTTRTVDLRGNSNEIIVYRHVWPRIWNDPMASTLLHKETANGAAARLRKEILKLCSK